MMTGGDQAGGPLYFIKGELGMDEWTALSVETSSEAVEAVANLLNEAGAAGVQIEDAADFQKLTAGKYGPHGEIVDPAALPHREQGAAVTGYFPPRVFGPELAQDIAQRVVQLADFGLNPGAAKVTVKDIDQRDWATAWQKYYHPVRVTRELTVVPAWEDYQPQEAGERLLRLDPGMAFGTGTHPTTKLMLQALTLTLRGGEAVIDVGTGSGVLAIAAKLLGAGTVQAYDIDPVAVKSARQNVALNPAASDVHPVVNGLLDGHHDSVDLVVANILAEIIVPLIPQAWDNLRPGGHFLVSGIIKDKAPVIKAALIKQGFMIDETLRIKDWYGMIAHRPAEDEQ